VNSLNDMSQIQGCVDSHLWTGVFMDWCAKYSVYCRLLYPRETCTDGRTDMIKWFKSLLWMMLVWFVICDIWQNNLIN